MPVIAIAQEENERTNDNTCSLTHKEHYRT